MKVLVKLDKGAYMPEKAHEEDAGFDLRTMDSKVVPARGCACFDTGVHMAIPAGYVGFLKSKSGLNVKNGLRGEGVIDAGYTGSIVVKLYNDSGTDYIFLKGEKISQIVILPIPEVVLEETDEFPVTERADNGFGSSGR